jgi:hypothetical protein
MKAIVIQIITSKNTIGGERSTTGDENANKILVGKPQGKRSLRILRCEWEVL